MNDDWKRPLIYAIGATATALFFLILLTLLPYYNRNQTTVKQLLFVGAYQTSGESSRTAIQLGKLPSASSNPEITLRGYFDRPLAGGEQLFFFIEHLEVQIFIGHTEVYSYGTPDKLPSTMHAAGITWNHLVVPHDMDPTDEWVIVLKSKYQNNYYSAYQDFLNSLQTGDSGALARAVLATHWPMLLGGVAVLLLTLLILILSIVLACWGVRIHQSVYLLIGFAACMGGFVLLAPQYSTLILPNPMLVVQLQTASIMLGSMMLTAYFGSLMQTRACVVNEMALLTLLLLSTGCLILQLAGLTDAYEMLTVLTIAVGLMGAANVVGIHYEIQHNSMHEFRTLKWPALVFLFLGILEMVNYGTETLPTGRLILLGFFVLLAAQLVLAAQYMQNALRLAQRTAQMERELIQSRIAIMLSQIQPHFLYNALSVIKGLCQIDPPRAEAAVDHFADFLRGNIDSLAAAAPIPFEQELLHTRHYLELEQMRFGKRLRIVYDTPVTSFRMPSLTLQPIVENSVRYGVTKRREGGTVTITTRQTDRAFTITVQDDGMGFCPEQPKPDGRTHIGISNVRTRLQTQCGGSLEIETAEGKGTIAVITIPKEGMKT